MTGSSHMTTTDDTRNEAWALAGLLSGRYGRLALTRAASEAAAAQRTGDKERTILWTSVVTHLRQTLGSVQASEAV